MTEAINVNDLEALNDLRDYSRKNQLWFSIDYSEPEDLYYGCLRGAGQGEDFEIKKTNSITSVCEGLINRAEELYKAIHD